MTRKNLSSIAFAGALLLFCFLAGSCASGSAAPNLDVDIVPVVNPWGWAHDTRFNAGGGHINRDFASFDTQEAQIVAGATDGQAHQLVVDHHEDPRRLIDAPLWGLRCMRLTKQLSSTNYYRLAGIQEVYTVETPVTLPLAERVDLHRLAFEHLSQNVATGSKRRNGE